MNRFLSCNGWIECVSKEASPCDGLSRCTIVCLVQEAIGGNMSEGFIRDY